MIKLLKKELIRVGSISKSKDEILKEISKMVKNQCSVVTEDQIFNALKEREELSSTGLGSSIAIPHCAFDKVDKFYVGLIVSSGVDFDSLDGEPAKLIFFSIGPKMQQNQHISTLTSISKISMDKALLSNLMESKDSNEVFKLLHRDDNTESKDHKKCQFIIHVQDEKLFQDLLEILASDVEGAISVIDAQTAGYYLHKLPLFSSFWNDVSDNFSKMVVAVIDKRLMNETVRRINMIKKDNNSGLLVTVNELLYFDGSLEY